jgi:photosystem II stability/assembly factor-like uncharacterized protein
MWILLLVLLFGSPAGKPEWSAESSGVDSNLRGVSVKYVAGDQSNGHYVIWASGSNGVIIRSTNDGKTWKQKFVRGGEDLDFRGIEAFDDDMAYAISSGNGQKSRIYKTIDGGASWTLQYSDKRHDFFLDSLACDSRNHCVALSDPVDGKFVVLRTLDGEHWEELSREKMPAALPNEGAFAASGTGIAICDHKIFFGTGGRTARVFRSEDGGSSWTVASVPIAHETSTSGIFSLACYGDDLVAVGGDYEQPNDSKAVAAYSDDSGRTWHAAASQPGGYRSAVAPFSWQDFVSVGLNGTDRSHDKGVHWQHTDRVSLNALSFDTDHGWAVGPKGTVARFLTPIQYQQ